MKSREFVKAYDATMNQSTWRQDEFSDYLKPAREWSHEFGQHLHHYLANREPLKRREGQDLIEYAVWAKDEGIHIANSIEADHPEETREKRHAMMELHFTQLNLDMLPMWRPILGKNWTAEKERECAIKDAISNIAVRATTRYNTRESLASAQHEFKYFSPEMKLYREFTNATLAEDDFALVGLKMMLKHPDITVVPAPMQFENNAKRPGSKSPNVDAVIVRKSDKDLYAIGAQVKSRRRERDEKRYDPDRAVIIDACEDMDSAIERQLNSRGYYAHQSWSGLLSAHELIAQRPQTHRLQSELGRQALIRQFRAKTNVRDTHSSIDYAIHQVSRQLLPHLGHDMPRYVRPSGILKATCLAG